jgi:hypothetical protein
VTDLDHRDLDAASTEREVLFRVRGVAVHRPRPPRRYLREITGGEAAFPCWSCSG